MFMKEYLLLRNNTELGHYSLEELRAMGLKAYDLVWVENKSCSWKYPSEINELAALCPISLLHKTGRCMLLLRISGNITCSSSFA